ncbi:MAG TPA: hypothetical protein VHT75_15915 [Acidimicrobiales bacterium]|nr:hypothetical protein [Acidimicrobiales bacterium]
MNRLRRTPTADEQGIALISSVLIMMVCTVVVTASLALAVHSNTQSADQRNLTAALHAADYGLQEELASLAGQPTSTGATCTAITGGILPGTSLPTQWFSVTMPACSAGSANRTIIATGYAIGAGANPPANPPTTAAVRTVVAHITLQPAGAVSNGGYGFPDAITALKGSGANQSGNITAAGASPLTVTADGPESIRADGAVTLTNGSLPLSSGQTAASLSAWDDVTLTNNPVTGNVVSGDTVSLNSSNVSGYVDAPTIHLGSPPSTVGSSRVGTVQLPTQPPVPTFTYSTSDWLAFTGAGAATTTCPSAGTLTGLYVLTSSCTATPAAIGTGAVAIIVNAAGNLTLTLPSYTGPGPSQLYLIVTNGNLTLTDAGASAQVFAYGSGTVSVSGTIVGQLAGGNIATLAATNLIAQTVSTTVSNVVTYPPDFSFPAAGSGPSPTGFVPLVNDEYLCSAGATTPC